MRPGWASETSICMHAGRSRGFKSCFSASDQLSAQAHHGGSRWNAACDASSIPNTNIGDPD